MRSWAEYLEYDREDEDGDPSLVGGFTSLIHAVHPSTHQDHTECGKANQTGIQELRIRTWLEVEVVYTGNGSGSTSGTCGQPVRGGSAAVRVNQSVPDHPALKRREGQLRPFEWLCCQRVLLRL